MNTIRSPKFYDPEENLLMYLQIAEGALKGIEQEALQNARAKSLPRIIALYNRVGAVLNRTEECVISAPASRHEEAVLVRPQRPADRDFLPSIRSEAVTAPGASDAPAPGALYLVEGRR